MKNTPSLFSRGRRRALAQSISVAALAIAAPWATAAGATAASRVTQPPETARPVSIRAQPLNLALIELSRQTGVSVFAESQVVEGKVSHALSGNLTPGAALQQMLLGTGLRRLNADGSYVVVKEALRVRRVSAVQAADPPPAAPPRAENGAAIGEIVVTAQRFTETAQRTPLIITAIESKDLVGVTDVRQLQTITPGIQLGVAGFATQTFIRGVGSLNNTTSQEGAVAYNADGVFLFSSTMISPQMYDLERIEVLKGPQGTLYGRNASGGAVNIITRGASLGRLEGYVEGEYGNYDEKRVTAAINVPVSQTLAVRLAGEYARHDGYLSDGTDDQNLSAGRLRLLWRPSSVVTLRVGVDGSRAGGNGPGTSINPNPTPDKFLGGLDPRAQTGPAIRGETSLLSAPPNPPPFFRDDQWSVFAQLDADLGFATLTVLPAYRHERTSSLNYIGGFSGTDMTASRQKSVEARLSDRSDTLRWVLGAYYFDINQNIVDNVRNETNFQNVIVTNPRSVESYAVFGEATYSLTDLFRVIGGLRYSKEKTRSTGTANALLGPPNLPPQTAAFNPFNPVTNPRGELLDYYIDGRSKADAVTWKFGAEFDLRPQSMLFATASRGFKGGGTYVDVPQANTAFRPEFLTAFELGSRNRFFDNTLQLNAELFYWKLKDQQLPFVGFNSLGQVTLLTFNAGKAHMDGADVDAVWKPTANDTFHAGVEYLNSEYDSFVRTVPSLSVLPSGRCAVSGYGGPRSLAPAVVDCSGQSLLRAPKWSGSASYEHRFDLSGGGEVTANVDMTFATSRFLVLAYAPLTEQKSDALFNGSLTYRPPNGAFSLTGWVRNIGNARVMSGGIQQFDFYSRPTLMPPRTYGVTGHYTF